MFGCCFRELNGTEQKILKQGNLLGHSFKYTHDEFLGNKFTIIYVHSASNVLVDANPHAVFGADQSDSVNYV